LEVGQGFLAIAGDAASAEVVGATDPREGSCAPSFEGSLPALERLSAVAFLHGDSAQRLPGLWVAGLRCLPQPRLYLFPRLAEGEEGVPQGQGGGGVASLGLKLEGCEVQGRS
tara:strand:- start:185 stop:523 length:339 start_codon:yes stop_codon:yes gene_type:complete